METDIVTGCETCIERRGFWIHIQATLKKDFTRVVVENESGNSLICDTTPYCLAWQVLKWSLFDINSRHSWWICSGYPNVDDAGRHWIRSCWIIKNLFVWLWLTKVSYCPMCIYDIQRLKRPDASSSNTQSLCWLFRELGIEYASKT